MFKTLFNKLFGKKTNSIPVPLATPIHDGTVKMLLLGTLASGKSTLYKQFKINFCDSYSEGTLPLMSAF